MSGLAHFTSWREGFRKVSFTKLLHTLGPMPLAEAKRSTDRLLDGEKIYVERPTVDAARILVDQAEQLGAVGQVLDARPVPSPSESHAPRSGLDVPSPFNTDPVSRGSLTRRDLL